MCCPSLLGAGMVNVETVAALFEGEIRTAAASVVERWHVPSVCLKGSHSGQTHSNIGRLMATTSSSSGKPRRQ